MTGFFDNVEVIVTAPQNDSEFTFDGFVLEKAQKHAVFNGTSADGSYANLILRDSENSQFSDWGTGMRVFESSPSLSSCVFLRNKNHNIFGAGAGLSVDTASPSISECVFQENELTYAGGTEGGAGAIIWFGNPTLLRCGFLANRTVDGIGGGLRVEIDTGVVDVALCEFSGNIVERSYPSFPSLLGGGGAYAHRLTHFMSCSFRRNKVQDDAGNRVGAGGGAFL
ncbi:MAG TPA: hypothetical protein VNT79_04355, partial [Phycisphaerae bacterium]|nr:hypothetical protein [Phycisphaerae bacterium]